MLEIREFRSALMAWLKSITKLTALVGTDDDARIYYGWPTDEQFPLVTFAIRRKPALDAPVPAWTGQVIISLAAGDSDVLDAMEDALDEWLSSDSNNILSTLSTAGKTLVAAFGLSEVSADDFLPALMPDGYALASRDLTYDFTLGALRDG